MTRVFLIVACAALMLSTPRDGHAQAFGRLEGLVSNSAVYTFARQGDATKRVYVWGTVLRPGLYEVIATTDLPGLLSLAGGPVIPLRTDETVVRVNLRLFRAEGGQRRVVFEAPVDSLLLQNLPVPQENDVIEVTTSQRRIRTWRDNLAVVGAGSAITVALVQLLQLIL